MLLYSRIAVPARPCAKLLWYHVTDNSSNRFSRRLRLWRWRLQQNRNLGTYGLIAVNATVFGLYSIAPEPQHFRWPSWTSPGKAKGAAWQQQFGLPTKTFFERHFMASYRGVVKQGRFETLPLCTFMHVDGSHLFFNMLTLFFVGRQVEQIIGSGRFLLFYLMSGTIAAATQVAACGKQNSTVPCIGASGGVYATLGFLTCLMPWQTVLLYFIVPCPLWLLTSGLLFLDVFYIRPGMGHEGHLAGAGCGIALWCLRYLRR